MNRLLLASLGRAKARGFACYSSGEATSFSSSERSEKEPTQGSEAILVVRRFLFTKKIKTLKI